jgi:hypothetical protein
MHTAVVAKGCPVAPPAGKGFITSLTISLAAPPIIGTPQQTKLKIVALDVSGNPVRGTYLNPISLALADGNKAHPHTHLNCATVYASNQVLPELTFDGFADSFALTATAQGATPAALAVTTTLPTGSALTRPSDGRDEDVPIGAIAFGAGGSIYSGIGDAVPATEVNTIPVFGRITTSGKLQKFVVHNRNQWPDGSPQCIAGGDGYAWCTSSVAGSDGDAIDRISPAGSVSALKVPNLGPVAGMVVDRSKNTWVVFGSTFVRVTPSGAIHTVATTSAQPMSLVRDPLGRGMWFGTVGGFGMVTNGGKITLYNVPGGTTVDLPTRFFLGPDGKFWAPWELDEWLLMKFDTSGHIVSWTPMPHAPNQMAPYLGATARDGRGNTYTIDQLGNDVIRIAPDGSTSSYPMLNASPQGIATGPDGKIYLTGGASFDNGSKGAGTLASFDPKYW